MAKKKYRINFMRLFVTVVIIVVIVATIFSVKNIISLHIEHKQLKESNRELELKKKKLENELKNVNDMDYIEEQARKQLRMVKPGEQIYIIDDENAKSDSENQTKQDKGKDQQNKDQQNQQEVPIEEEQPIQQN